MIGCSRDAYNNHCAKSSRKKCSIGIMLKSPPTKLSRLLEIVNLVPPSCEIPSLERVVETLLSEAGVDFILRSQDSVEGTFEAKAASVKRGIAEADSQTVEKALYKCLQGLPAQFRNYVFEKTSAVSIHELLNPVAEAVKRYNFVRDAREALQQIVHLSSLSAEQRGVESWFNPLLLSSYLPRAPIHINEEGIITVKKDAFLEAIDEVEVARIRECQNKNCGRLFWAGRINQPCCSPECAHAYRNQRYRARYRDPEDAYKTRKLSATEKSNAKKNVDLKEEGQDGKARSK
jgi:hypothetical protein